eukprot:1631993-Ditylum_brightwellii.AAC.1
MNTAVAGSGEVGAFDNCMLVERKTSAAVPSPCWRRYFLELRSHLNLWDPAAEMDRPPVMT